MATKVAPELLKDVCAEHNLTHVKTEEKNPLPSAEDVQQERHHLEHLQNVEAFNAGQLQHTRTKERVMLPDSSSEFMTSVVSVVMATNCVILCSVG